MAELGRTGAVWVNILKSIAYAAIITNVSIIGLRMNMIESLSFATKNMSIQKPSPPPQLCDKILSESLFASSLTIFIPEKKNITEFAYLKGT